MAIQTWKNDLDDAGVWLCHPAQPLSYIMRDLEIIFVLDGELEIKKRRDTRKLKQADFTIINPPVGYERIAAIPTRLSPVEDCYFLLLRISPSFLSGVFGGKVPVFDYDSARQTGDFSVVRSILAEIASADTGGGGGRLFYSRLYRLLEELRANFTVQQGGTSGETFEGEKRRQVIYSYIRKHFREPISLEETASILSVTPQYFSKRFKKMFGVNFHAYLKQLRLESALKELGCTNKSVTAIAYDSGFPNPAALIKNMKEAVKQTPAAYRKSCQNKTQEKAGEPEVFQSIDPATVKDKLAPFIGGNTSVQNSQKNISADAQGGVLFEKPWQEVINLGFATDFEKSEFLRQIEFLQNEASFRYARFQGLFGKSMLSVNEGTKYSFAKIDRVIDLLYSTRLLPFIELGFKPAKVNKNTKKIVFSNPNEIENFPTEEYERIIEGFLKHAINRYGMQEVSRWRFEYWEAKNDMQFPLDDIDTYIDQFSRIRNTIKKMVPAAQVGGPGCQFQLPMNILGNLLRGLKAKNSLPDFYSYYVYHLTKPEDQGMMDSEDVNDHLILFTRDELIKRIAEIQEYIKKILEEIETEYKTGFHEPPFYITEWNFDFSGRSLVHDSLFMAPFLIQNSINTINKVNAIAYWLASDISAEYTDSDAPLFGGPGLISRNGIRKPAFFAYQFLSKLGGRILAKGEGYIVTEKSEDEFVIILLNYKYIASRIRFAEQLWHISGNLNDYLEDNGKCSISVEIRNITSGQYKVRQHILNSLHGSIYDTWMNLSAIHNLQKTETEWLERICFPNLRIDLLTAKGSLVIDYELEPNEVRLLEISRILE
jgi:beta-xylosidase/AraC-like DNA-binding protein